MQKNKIIESAVRSVLQIQALPQIGVFPEQASVPLKALVRRASALSIKAGTKKPTPTEILKSVNGMEIRFDEKEYCAVINDAEPKLSKGQKKRLMRTVDRVTGKANPDSGKGKIRDRIYQNPSSRVVARRRMSPKWATSAQAEQMRLLSTKISLVPFSNVGTNSVSFQQASEKPARKKEVRKEKIAEEVSRRLEDGSPLNIPISTNKRRSQEAEQLAKGFMGFVKTNSVMPPQRPKRIRELIKAGFLNEQNPIFLNFICPPGTPLALGKETGQLYRRFTDIDAGQGFEKDYRLYPRLELEKSLARALRRLGMNSEYWKIVADDNAPCLYPEGLKIDGRESTYGAIQNYAGYVQNRLNEELNPETITVTTWADLLGKFDFERMIDMFNETRIDDLLPYLPNGVIDTELDVLTKHTEPNPKLLSVFKTFAENVIRQYAVEGLMLYEIFGDNVVLAWNESTRRAGIVDALRKAEGIPPLPKIFVLHEKREGKIINNF